MLIEAVSRDLVFPNPNPESVLRVRRARGKSQTLKSAGA